jgi:uncharacterized membrane protein
VKRFLILTALLLTGILLTAPLTVHAQDAQPVVRAVLFYSPTCPHCHLVINETLPPLMERYGDQLQIAGIDITQPDGSVLFGAALQSFGLQEGGVPFLVVGDTYMVGSAQIPQEFPGLIESLLASGGMDWPAIPGLQQALAPMPSADQAAVPAPGRADSAGGWRAKFAQDPAGNTLSVVVLTGMLAAVIWSAISLNSRTPRRRTAVPVKAPGWLIPVLSVIGLGVAGYLAYLELSQAEPFCGPIGHCDIVQQSKYARLFGLFPIGVMGVAGYLAILAAWLIARYAPKHLVEPSAAALLVMTGLGTLFSIYLTFLEPFVIGATCMWCLTSSVLMTVLMLACLEPGKRSLAGLLKRR